MSHSSAFPNATTGGRYRPGGARRPVALGLTIAIQALVVLLLMWVAPTIPLVDKMGESLSSFDVTTPDPPSEAAAAPDTPTPDRTVSVATAPPVPRDAPPARLEPPPATPPTPLPWIELSREQMVTTDSAVRRPPAPAPAARTGPSARPYGPTGSFGSGAGDSQRVEGSGPNGEPLYAETWYRRPYPDEVLGYLSTARGPGWAMIACRTVADFRVEDCVAIAESPQGSNIARAVLAAAWQFRVRPPQIGGRPQVGAWVRIRIDYTRQPAGSAP